MARVTLEEAAHFNVQKHRSIEVKVEENAALADEVITEIVSRYSERLDSLIAQAREALYANGELSNAELDWYISSIPLELYYLRSFQDNVQVRSDIAEITRKRLYIDARMIAEGTISDKDAQADAATMQESLTAMAYKRSVAIVKNKVESAVEILASFKKIRSARMEEASLNRYQGGSV